MDFMGFKKKFFRYLINHYLGQFLENKFSLEQITVDLYNGTGYVRDIVLDCQALNSVAEEQNIPVEFLEASLKSISISVPWKKLMQESCQVEVHGLYVAIQAKNRVDNGNSMLNSMFTSMASSMHLAEDFIRTCETEEDQGRQNEKETMPGLEAIAKTIEAVLSRIKVNFQDTTIRVERANRPGSNTCIGLELHVKSWSYSDESCGNSNPNPLEDSRLYDTAFQVKKFVLQGIKLFTDVYKQPSPFDTATSSSNDDNQADNLILAVIFSGSTDIGLRIKTDESMGGPQISVDCSFGSMISLLTPAQVHIILLILKDFLEPPPSPSQDGSTAYRHHMKEKPMDSFDFMRIKEELEETNRKDAIGLPGIQHPGWSGFEDDSEERFLPFKTKSGLFSSVHSNLMETSMISDMGASVNQSMIDSTTSIGVRSGVSSLASPYKSPTGQSHLGMNMLASQADKTKFAVSIASVAVILLHEDILALSSSMAVAPSTAKEMQKFSKEFFKQVGFVTANGKKQIEETKKCLEKACPKSCLRLIAAPLKVEGLSFIENSLPVTSGHVSFAFFELVELLKDNDLGSGPKSILTELLHFPSNMQTGAKESLKIEFRHRSLRSRTSMTKTDIRIFLQECVSEFDMSIIDRLNSLLQPKLPFILDGHNQDNPNTSLNKAHSAIFFKITSPKCSVDFRFPIPDMRKSDDANKVPYWTRNVRSDSIIFCLKDLTFNTSVNSQSDVLQFDTQCQEAQLYYKSFPTDTPLLFATASANDINNINNDYDMESPSLQGFDRPRVVVSIYPERKAEIVSDASTKFDDEDGLSNLINLSNCPSAPSPFSANRVIHQCLSSSPEERENESFGETVTPGNQEEMKRFIDDTTQNVLYKVDCNLRSVNIKMPSKEFFEELYNRLSMDLLLWEPLAPKLDLGESDSGSSFRGCLGPQQFSMRSQRESDSDTEDDEPTFYSVADKIGAKPQRKSAKKQKEKAKRVLPQGQSEVTINLAITHGVCAFFTPFEDTMGNILQDMKGQVTLEIEKGNLFIVSGYKGNRNSGYLCLHSNRATFFHSEHVKSSDLIPRTDSQLKRTIYPSEEGVLSTRAPPETAYPIAERRDMLAVAIKIDKDELKNVKNFKVAIGIKDGTIDYRMSFPNRNWFTQIVDFFDVTDVSVEGYTPSAVFTELHVNLWNCAASYTPLHLPLRSFLTLGSLSISVNIIAQMETKVIRFISEDAALFLTNKKESSDLRHDYVCVMDMDLFDLVMRIGKGVPQHHGRTETGAPQFDLKASNNLLHIRTCSDSMKHLLELITHFGNNGDLPEKDDILSELDDFREGGCGFGNQNAFAGSSSNVFVDTEDGEFGKQVQQTVGTGIGTGTGTGRDRRFSQTQNPFPTQVQTDFLHNMVAEAMQENISLNSKSKSTSNSNCSNLIDGSSKRFGSTSSGLGRSPKSRSDSGNAGSGFGGVGRPQSIEIHFDPGQKVYTVDGEGYSESEGQLLGRDVDEGLDDFNGSKVEDSNASTPAPPLYEPLYPPLFNRDDPIMESCDGLPVNIQMSDEDEEEFCILENDPGVGFLPRDGEPEIRFLTDEPIVLVENHFTIPVGKVDILQAPKRYPKPVTRFTIQEMSVIWHVYGGEDFGTGSSLRSAPRTNFGGSSEALSTEYTRSDSYDREEVDVGVDAVYYSTTKAFEKESWEAYESPKSQRRLSIGSGSSWRTQGGKGRQHDVQVELQLSKIKFRHEIYPQHTEQASRQVLVINSVEIQDKVKTSKYNKLLHLYTSPALPRQSCANMVFIKAAHIRPDPQLAIEECLLKISLLPIKLNIDQGTILFVYKFFNDIVDTKADDEEDSISSSSARPPSHTPSCESLPVMMVNTKEGGAGGGGVEDLKDLDLQSQGQIPQPSSSFDDEFSTDRDDSNTNPIAATQSFQPRTQDDNVSVCSKDPSVDSLKQSVPIYFREVIFSPEVPVSIDYRGNNIFDMTNGHVAGLFMALGQLESANLRLIQLTNKKGILGVGKVLAYFGSEWASDIKTNQIPGVLSGVDILLPMHSFVQLFQGVKNLFVLPVEQYQKDGRLAKGLQRGVNSFSTSAAMAFLKLSNRIVQVFQGAAEFTYDMVSPGPSVQQQRRNSSTRKKRYSQPSDVREGVTNAYNVVREGLGNTAHDIVRVVSKENEQKGVSGAVGGVLRQIPPALIFKPMILAAEATSNVLEGLKSQLEPETKKEAAEKWKKESYD